MSTVNVVQGTTYTLSGGNNPITFGVATSIETAVYKAAVYGDNTTAWSVTNAGSLIGGGGPGGWGVQLMDGGSITSQSTGTIRGGVDMDGAEGTISNSGSIYGYEQTVVRMEHGGTMTNGSTGAIILTGTGQGVTGVWLNASGISGDAAEKVVNQGAIIVGGSKSISGVIALANATVNNSGDISVTSGAYGSGVEINSGGSATNSGSIETTGTQVNGINATSGGVVSNSGTITASGTEAAAIALNGGGSATNTGLVIASGDNASGIWSASGATVVNKGNIDASGSGSWGVRLRNGSTLTNSGAIAATGVSNDGVSLNNGGSITNSAGGRISSGSAVAIVATGGGDASITDAGRIIGKTVAVDFAGTGANVLTLQTGASLTGEVLGSTALSASNTLVLQGKGATKSRFVHFGVIDVAATGSWNLSGVSAIGVTNITKGDLVLSGTLTTTFAESAGATLTLSGGLAKLAGASTFSGVIAGKGDIDVLRHSTATVSGKVGASDTFFFTGPAGGELVLKDMGVGVTDTFHGKVSGFAKGDELDVAAFGAGTSFVFTENASATSGVLTISKGTTHASITFAGDLSASHFTMTSDGHGGQLFTYA